MKKLLLALLALLFASPVSAKVLLMRRANTTTAMSMTLAKAYYAMNMKPTTPIYYCDYTKGVLCGAEDWYWRDTAAYTYRNSSNAITYAPNNLVLRSADMAADPFTASRVQTIATDGSSNYILKCEGSGSIAYSGSYSTGSPLDCTAEGEVLMTLPTAANLVLTPTGTTTNVRLVKVLTEATFAARNGVDDVNTGSQPFFGPRVDGNGWLVEGNGYTNLMLYSNTFDNAVYNKEGSDFAPAAAISPDGTNDAWSVTTDTFSRVRQAIEGGGGSPAPHTLTIRAKYSTAPWMRLCLQNAGGNSACMWYDLQNGVAGTDTSGCQTGSCKATMEPDPYGNGWYVLTFTASISARGDEPNCAFDNCVTAQFGLDNEEGSWSVTDNRVAYVYGFTASRWAGSTAYLPTQGTSIGNYGEVADISDPRIGQARAIVFETASPPGRHNMGYSSSTYILGVNNRGPFGEGVLIEESTNYLATIWAPTTYHDSNLPIVATTANSIKYRTATQTSINRYGIAYDGEHISLSLNGGVVARKAQSTPVPAVFTLSTTSIFTGGGTPDWPITTCDCYVKSLALYQDLSDAQLRRKTMEGTAP